MSFVQAAALHNICIYNVRASNIFAYTMLGLLGSSALGVGYLYVTKSINQNKQNVQGAQGAQGGKRSTCKRRSLRA